ncbi:MAG: fold metallo-hydrolase [Bacteroidetes bacterium]|nr:fold metallo-hydrolase [Bacteroidota bacterium]
MNQLTIAEASVLLDDGTLVIDTRPSSLFLQGFIPGAIHIPLSDRFKEYAELTLDPEYSAIIVAEKGQEEKACRDLAKTGVVTIAGYLDGGYDAWLAAGGASDLIIDIDAEEFGIDYKFDEFYLIDTRSDDEYESEHIEYAENIPLSEIEETAPSLNAADSYYIYGSSIEDAAFAASLFRRSDFFKIRVVTVGYDDLKATEIPIVKKKKAKNDSKFSDN